MSLRTKALAMCCVVLSMVVGCAWQPIAYTPNPAAVPDPVEDSSRRILTQRYAPLRLEIDETSITLFYLSSRRPRVTIFYDEIEEITMVTARSRYAVKVVAGAERRVWHYHADSQEDAQEFVDALTALVPVSYTHLTLPTICSV